MIVKFRLSKLELEYWSMYFEFKRFTTILCACVKGQLVGLQKKGKFVIVEPRKLAEGSFGMEPETIKCARLNLVVL